jgi:hypothetical protein
MEWVYNKVRTLLCGRKRQRSTTEDEEIDYYNNIMSLKKRTLNNKENYKPFSKKLATPPTNKIIKSNKMDIFASFLSKKNNTRRNSEVLMRENLPELEKLEELEINETIVSRKSAEISKPARKEIFREEKEPIFSEFETLSNFIQEKNDKKNFPEISLEQFNKIER